MNKRQSRHPTVYGGSLIGTVILLVFLFGLVSSVQAGRHVVSSLPYTFTSSDHTGDAVDTIVLGSSKISTSGNGLLLQAEWGDPLHDVLVDLGDDTISFGEGGNDGAYGLRITGTSSYYPHDIEVRGGYILHNPPDTTVDGVTSLSLSGYRLLIKDVTATVKGYNGTVVLGTGRYCYESVIDGGRFRSYVTGFDSRCNYDACVIKLYNLYQEAIDEDGAEYHWKVRHAVVENGPHVGIFLAGREGGDHYAIGEIYACSISTDARNDFYDSYQGTCLSCTNPYGISCRHVDAGTVIRKNTIKSGTQFGGNRGILFEYGRGSESNPIIVDSNYVYVHEGPNVEYGDRLPVHGLRIRYAPQHFRVYDNVFISVADNSESTTHTGPGAVSARLSLNQPTADIRLSNNRIESQALSSSGVDCWAMDFDGVDYDSMIFLNNNRISSSGYIYKFGDIGTQDIGPTGIMIEGDTVEFLSPTVSPATYYLGHLSNDWNCSRNYACDVVYEGGTSYDDIHFANDGTLDIKIQKTLSVYVRDTIGQAIPGASVAVRNHYGQTVISGMTGTTGSVSGRVTYLFRSRTATDSTNYNSFDIVVWKSSDSVETTVTVDDETVPINLQLLNTEGTLDTIPPAPTEDLGASPGTYNGTISLAWTAPGDDWNVGIANGYEVRYSTGLITEGNWGSAAVYGGSSVPTPLLAGTRQTLLMGGLTAGAIYYVALKSWDRAGNISELSNVDSAEATVSIISDANSSEPEPLSCTEDSIVNTTRPVLIVSNVGTDPDNIYTFEVADDSGFIALAAATSAVLQEPGITTAWQVSPRLEPHQRYFWRARVNDGDYSRVVSFCVQPAPHAYPNPFLPADVSQVTFAEIPAGSNLVLMTLSGNVVKRWVNTSGEDVYWNGVNESGNQVASGTYLWFIEESDAKGKLIVVR